MITNKNTQFSEKEEMTTISPPPQWDIERESFFERIANVFREMVFRSGDTDITKKRLLRYSRNQVKKSKIKIYDLKKEQITFRFPKILFEIYRFTYPLKSIVRFASDQSAVKTIEEFYVENSLNSEQKELLLFFEEDNLYNVISAEGIKEANKTINDKFHAFQKSFTKEITNKVNQELVDLKKFSELIQYDMYPMLKAFSPYFIEEKYLEPPQFRSIDGKEIIEKLKDFSDVLYNINLQNENLISAILLLLKYKNTEVITEKELERFVSIIKLITVNNYVPLIIQIIDQDPFYRPKIEDNNTYNMVHNYFKNISQKIKVRRDNILRRLHDLDTNKKCIELFGTSEIPELKFYNETNNNQFIKVNALIYKYTSILSFLKHFLIEKYDHSYRELINKCLVEGTFVNPNIIREPSEAYFNLNDTKKKIINLDNELGDEGKDGQRLKSLLLSLHKEPSNKKVIDEYVTKANEVAEEIIYKSYEKFNILIRFLYKCHEDHIKNTKGYMLNAQTIDGQNNRAFMIQVDQTISDLVKLTDLYRHLVSKELLGIS